MSREVGPLRIALLAPMAMELRPLVRRLGLVRDAADADSQHVGHCGGAELLARRIGVGMRAAADAATRVLETAHPDHVVVVGVAGAIAPGVAVGDLVIPEAVLDVDRGAEYRAAPLGAAARRGLLASSSSLVEDADRAATLAARGVLAIDMETAAVAAACEREGCPWSAFRAISDRADDGGTDSAILGLIGSDGRPRLAAVLRLLLAEPRRAVQLGRLSRDTGRATRRAAEAAAEALARVRPR